MQDGSGVEAGTLFDPLFGFDLAVAVQVGTEVAVPHYPTAGIISEQHPDQHTKRMLLEVGTGVGRTAVQVITAFVADADGVRVVPFGVCAGLLQRAEGFDVSVLAYVEVIACAGESPAQMVCDQVVFRITTVSAGGAAMND